MWTPDGHTLYFVCDRGGAANICSLTIGGKLRQITSLQRWARAVAHFIARWQDIGF